MSSSFKTEDVSQARDPRVTAIDRISRLSEAKKLPEGGGELPPEQQVDEPDEEQMQQAVGIMNDHVQMNHRQLQFSVEKDINKVVITVLDSDTKEVIRQIPSEEALNYARKLAEGSGLEIFDNFA